LYISIYIYPVAVERTGRFLEIQDRASAVCREHGALNDWTYAPADLGAKYGCLDMLGSVEAREGEDVFVGITSFRDRAHHDEVMSRVDADPRIDELFAAIAEVVDVGRIRRGEFLRV
jgi:uncharacterized protein YbaA (DUF1428 family)